MNEKLTNLCNDQIRIKTKRLNPLDSVRVRFGVYRFPDGQLQVIFHKNDIDQVLTNHLFIEASCYTPELLHILEQILFLLTKKGCTMSIKVQYLYGARSDKDESEEFYTCNVSELAIETIGNYSKYGFNYLAPHCAMHSDNTDFSLPEAMDMSKYNCILFPDKSANLRYKKTTDVFNYPYIIASKRRDQDSGKIVSYEVPELSPPHNRVLVIDDLCDYGTTFKLLAENLGDNVKKDLFIHHGVFTENAPSRLLEHYENIHVTNSLPFPEMWKQQLSQEQKDRLHIHNVWIIEK